MGILPTRIQSVIKRAANGANTGIKSVRTQFLFYPQQTVVFGNSVRTAQRTGFDLSGAGGNGQVGNEGVFGFSTAV
jgi:hypothetical protein